MKTWFSQFLWFVFSSCALLWLMASPVSAQSPPSLMVQVSNGSVWLSITGDVGSACTIQWTTNLYDASNWQFLTNLTPVLNSPCVVTDAAASVTSRFYRAFAQQVPTEVVPRPNMVWISPGTFIMGSPASEAQRLLDETQHRVTLTKGFYVCKYMVTQGDFLALMGINPGYFTTQDAFGNPISPDLNRPVEQVSWYEATNYCAQLTQQEQAAGRLPSGWVYRLPTESEWEYACRAGTTSAFYYGRTLRGWMANFCGYYGYDAASGQFFDWNPNAVYLQKTTTVGSYQPNAWGLYDMHGNLWEWCQDLYGDYPAGSVTDPQGPPSGSGYVTRGGSWGSYGVDCRSARRGTYYKSGSDYNVGFRIVLAPGQP